MGHLLARLAGFFGEFFFGLLDVAEEFAGEDSGEDEGGSKEGAGAEALADEDVGSESGEDRFEGEDKGGMGGRSEALRPGLDDEAGDRSEEGGDGQGGDHGGGEADEAVAVRDGDGDDHPEGADGDFNGDKVGEVVVLGAASEDDDLEGEGDGTAEGEQVSAIEGCEGESLVGRDAEKVEADKGGGDSGDGVAVDVASPEDSKQKRHEDDAESGEEGRLGSRGVEEAGGLEFIAEPHEGSNFKACAESSDGEAA